MGASEKRSAAWHPNTGPVDPTADERERMARAIADALRGDDVVLGTAHWNRDLADALRAAGFGDVAAERARAEADSTEVETWRAQARETLASLRLAIAERDALQARIDAAPHDPRQCDLIHYPDRRRKGTATCTCWKSTVDEPAPTPEPPHLDPLPWMGPTGDRFPDENHQSDIAKRDGYFARWFAPRPEDENGKPHEQRRGFYGGGNNA